MELDAIERNTSRAPIYANVWPIQPLVSRFMMGEMRERVSSLRDGLGRARRGVKRRVRQVTIEICMIL